MLRRIAFSEFVRQCHQQGRTATESMPCITERFDDGDVTVQTSHPLAPPLPAGLGDRVADGLAAVGITKQRVSRWTGKKDCGCKKRQELLNKLGQKVVDFVRGNNADQLDDKPH